MMTAMLFLLGLSPNPCEAGLFRAKFTEYAPNIYIMTGYDCVPSVRAQPRRRR